jgi:hypothetical protein
MDVKRFERGLFGRMADQSSGEYMAESGLLNEKGLSAGAMGWHHLELQPLGRRLFTIFMPTNGWNFLENHDWRYSQLGSWMGYRGKRYIQPLPCDDWDETRFWQGDRRRLSIFLTPLGMVNFGFECAHDHTLSVGDDYRVIIGGHTYNYIRIKDYSPEREEHKNHLDIILVSRFHILKHDEHSHTIEDKGDYVLHTFGFSHTDFYGRSFRLSKFGGQKKVIIQINGMTRFTESIVIPPYSSFRENSREGSLQNSVLIDINYWG